MITEVLMKKFCSEDFHRDNLINPFYIDNNTYATDGHIAIEIEGKQAYATEMKSESIKKAILKIFDTSKLEDNSLWVELPSLENISEEVECKSCEGTGKCKTCPDCDGSGEVSWESDSGFNYEADCKMCHGNGKITDSEDTCDNCNGKGKVIIYKDIYIGAKLFNSELLLKIKELPGILIHKTDIFNLEPTRFTFDGGTGVIMPKRPAKTGD